MQSWRIREIQRKQVEALEEVPVNSYGLRPQVIYQGERLQVLLQVISFLLWLLVLGGALAAWLFERFGFSLSETGYWLISLLTFAFTAAVMHLGEIYATYRALLRCQRTGLLPYVRTREVLRMRRDDRRSGSINYPPPGLIRRQKFGFLRASIFLSSPGILSISGASYWGNNPSVVTSLETIGPLFVIVAFGAGPEYVSLLLARFSISSEGIRMPCRFIPWAAVAECHIERDYGSQTLLSKMPRWKVTLFGEGGRRLGGFKLDSSKGAKPEDYVLVYEALLANLGYSPEPGAAEPPGHCTPDPIPVGASFGAM